jgi:sugar/nucleoside kinase (ribokinase family)
MHDILVIGNVNADWVFRLDEPIRPGLETTGEDLGLRAGGAAANAASALAVAGNPVRLVGFIGSDEIGDRLLRLMVEDGRSWDIGGVVRLEGPTPACLILIDPNGERVIIGTHRNRTAPQWPVIPVAGAACAYAASRWGLPDDLTARLKAAEVPIVSQWRPGYTVREADVLVVSENELPPQAVADPWQAAQGQGLAPSWLVVTQGPRGAYATDGTTRIVCPPLPAEVVDSTGAGDAFAGGLVHGIARRWPIEACLRVGAAWGARAVAHLGSTFPKLDADSLVQIASYPSTDPVTHHPYIEVTSV